MAALGESEKCPNEVECSFLCLRSVLKQVETRKEYEQANFVQMWKWDARTGS
jgi:hypothetical protein